MTYRREEEEARSRALEVTASLANTKMSARERNRAKRKAKEAAKLAKQQDRYQRALARRTWMHRSFLHFFGTDADLCLRPTQYSTSINEFQCNQTCIERSKRSKYVDLASWLAR